MARLLLVILVSLVPSSVLAAPIVWAWAGTVTDDTGLQTMPVGTPLKLTYFADSSAANNCGAGAAMGLYTGGHAVLDVQSTMGAASYTASASYLWINAFGTVGCGLVAPVSELRLSDWSGPSIPCPSTCDEEQKVNPTFVGLAPGGLFFLGSPLSGPAFPTEQPVNAYLQGPWFALLGIRHGPSISACHHVLGHECSAGPGAGNVAPGWRGPVCRRRASGGAGSQAPHRSFTTSSLFSSTSSPRARPQRASVERAASCRSAGRPSNSSWTASARRRLWRACSSSCAG